MYTVRLTQTVKSILILILLTPFGALAQPADSVLASLIRNGNADGLLEHFDESIDLGLPDSDQDYGRNQALMVMRDFFKKYPPAGFELQESGFTSEDNMFLIGDYATGDDTYQLLVLLKKSGSAFLIQKMKFELKKPLKR